METLVLVLGVPFIGLSVADPPEGLYIAQGVDYVGCFEHGQAHHEQVLNVQISPDCSFNHPGSCLTPPTCIDSCRNTSTSYMYEYIGLKFPGQCFCDSVLRGVNQTDSVDGTHCDGRCSDYTTVTGYTTAPEDVPTTTYRGHNQPQVSTGLIAGVTAGVAALVGIVVAVVCVYMWRRKKTSTDKTTDTERTRYVNGQFLDDEQRARTNQDVPYRNQPIPPSRPSSDVYLEPGVPVDDHEYVYIDNRNNIPPVNSISVRPTLPTSNDNSGYVNQPPNHSYVNASATGVGRESLVYDDVLVPRRNRNDGGGQYVNVGYRHDQDGAYVNVTTPPRR
ncbi:hypothetical protein Bbelb_358500 [Branchiostoma belcheri]|nr:hypothetical protein Bbelb_358500 [Branchiostoma belcheri]